jgi:hypothetical protein
MDGHPEALQRVQPRRDRSRRNHIARQDCRSADTTTLLNVTYDPAREQYRDFNRASRWYGAMELRRFRSARHILTTCLGRGTGLTPSVSGRTLVTSAPSDLGGPSDGLRTNPTGQAGRVRYLKPVMKDVCDAA